MKLISLNCGIFEDNNQEVTDFLRQQQPDIALFQEVLRPIAQHLDDRHHNFRYIQQATSDLNHDFYAPIWILDGFRKADFHGHDLFEFDLGGQAEFGQYCCSRYPIIKGQNVFVQNHFTYVTDWSNWPQEDYRAVQITDLQLPQSKLRLLNYHGIWSRDKMGNESTKQACHRIKELALVVDYPSIIVGDFNLFPETESMSLFYDKFENLVDTYDIKTTRPDSNELSQLKRNVVDYILVSNGIKVNDFEVLGEGVSDHLALKLVFEI